MKTLITTLNSKYIHTSLSVRLLYVATYHDFDIDFKEYTIKDSLEHIVDDLISMNLDVVAFSCYIWNIEYIEKICQMLRTRQPEIIMILGGPEVTYEPQYFLNHFPIDYVISGEGELVFPQLLLALRDHLPVCLEGVSDQHHISQGIAIAPLEYVETLDSPYQLPQDQDHIAKRIFYFETSRGCPFQCQYCLSSLEKGLRFFSEEYLKKQLEIICQSPVKTIKFLDRSFNANADHAIMILEYIFEHYRPGQQFQFEINADVLNQRIIDFIREKAPKGLLRFEIGIQSTYEPTNRAVKRMQNFERLSEVVHMLMEDGKCDLHLDLIAGLPYEDFERFAQSFDDVFAFRAKELQLGFLKLLRGTSLRNNADDYGYIYQQEPPYEMLENHWLSQEDMTKIHMAEDMLEKYWNSGRFVHTMNAVMDNVSSPFAFFYDLACFYESHQYKKIGYQLDELYHYLDTYLPKQYHDYLIMDYLLQFKVKPKKWYISTLSAQQRKETIRYLSSQYQLNAELLFRYAVIEKLNIGYLVVIYKDYQCHWDLYQ